MNKSNYETIKELANVTANFLTEDTGELWAMYVFEDGKAVDDFEGLWSEYSGDNRIHIGVLNDDEGIYEVVPVRDNSFYQFLNDIDYILGENLQRVINELDTIASVYFATDDSDGEVYAQSIDEMDAYLSLQGVPQGHIDDKLSEVRMELSEQNWSLSESFINTVTIDGIEYRYY